MAIARRSCADGIEALWMCSPSSWCTPLRGFWSRPPDDTHPFGHGRMETLVAVCIGVCSWGCFRDRMGSISTLHEQHVTPPGWIAAAAAWSPSSARKSSIAGRWDRTPHQKRCGDRHPWHYRSDAFSSIPVVIAVTGAILLPSWTFLDHLGAVGGSMFILHAAFKITWPSLKELIDVGPPPRFAAGYGTSPAPTAAFSRSTTSARATSARASSRLARHRRRRPQPCARPRHRPGGGGPAYPGDRGGRRCRCMWSPPKKRSRRKASGNESETVGS